jgi:Asp-tRNA(Asn)/Glu-tRNA(Gln) amidotransferase A subunit family amidase
VSEIGKPQARSYFAAAQAFRDGTDTPRAFLERCIATIEALDPQVGAFVATNLPAARTAADAATARWRSRTTLSLIDGMPVGIKDIMETADMVTEQGSPLFVGWRGRRDAAAVAALREAGAVIIGKTVTTEFAATHPRGTRNPWDLERTPGGSSSGSAAAVASGMVPAALGTQVIGSIVRPSSFCGCIGYKPSVGGINRGGSFDEFSQSCTGVLAASLAETWTVAREISARAGGDPGFPGVSGPVELPPARTPRRIALLETAGWQRATEEAKQALRRACSMLAGAGIEIADRTSDRTIEAVEAAIGNAWSLSMDINAWEGRWPLNGPVGPESLGAGPPRQGRVHDAGAVPGAARRAPARPRGARRTARSLRGLHHLARDGSRADRARIDRRSDLRRSRVAPRDAVDVAARAASRRIAARPAGDRLHEQGRGTVRGSGLDPADPRADLSRGAEITLARRRFGPALER